MKRTTKEVEMGRSASRRPALSAVAVCVAFVGCLAGESAPEQTESAEWGAVGECGDGESPPPETAAVGSAETACLDCACLDPSGKPLELGQIPACFPTFEYCENTPNTTPKQVAFRECNYDKASDTCKLSELLTRTVGCSDTSNAGNEGKSCNAVKTVSVTSAKECGEPFKLSDGSKLCSMYGKKSETITVDVGDCKRPAQVPKYDQGKAGYDVINDCAAVSGGEGEGCFGSCETKRMIPDPNGTYACVVAGGALPAGAPTFTCGEKAKP